MRSLFAILPSIMLLFASCGEVHRLRAISTQNSYMDASRVVESILWEAEQAAIRGERSITYHLKPGSNVSEICGVIKDIDRRFKIEKIGAALKVCW